MKPRLTFVLGAVALALAGALIVSSLDAGTEDAALPERPGAAATAAVDFLDTYVEPDGRVVRRDQGGDTVSEGQAYALLLAVAIGDESRFTAVWEWTRDNLQRDDDLFAWRWQDGAVVDDQPAADADLDIASALLAAGDQFDRSDLIDDAGAIAAGVLEHEVIDVDGTLVLVAGPWAAESRIVNPSYLARCGFDLLADATGDARWTALGQSSLDLLAELVADGLPPDWATVDPSGDLVPIAGPDDRGGEGRYGLDAARIPARLAGCDDGRGVAARLWPRLGDLVDDGARLGYRLDGTPMDDARHPVGLVGAAGAAIAADQAEAATDLLDAAAELAEAHATYYGDVWVALGETLTADVPDQLPVLELASAAAPLQDPSTTAPPTTAPPTTAPPTTAPPTTAPPTTAPPTTAPDTTGPPTTIPGTTAPPTSAPMTDEPPSSSTTLGTGEQPATGSGSSGSGAVGSPGVDPNPDDPLGPPPGSSGTAPDQQPSARSGDLTAGASPEVVAGVDRAPPTQIERRRNEGRRTVATAAVVGLSAAVALGAALGASERAASLRSAAATVGRSPDQV